MSTKLNFDDLASKACIDLSFNNLHDGNIDVLVQVLEKSTALKELNLYSNRIALADDAFTNALAANTSLQILSLGSNEIATVGGKRLAAAIKSHTSLKELHLGDNQIGDEGAKGFAVAFTCNTTSIETLGLYGNVITNVGADSLAMSFKMNTSLRVVWLHDNKIGEEGAKKLSELGEDDDATIEIHTLLGAKKIIVPATNVATTDDDEKKLEVTSAVDEKNASADVVVMKQLNEWGAHISTSFKTILGDSSKDNVTASSPSTPIPAEVSSSSAAEESKMASCPMKAARELTSPLVESSMAQIEKCAGTGDYDASAQVMKAGDALGCSSLFQTPMAQIEKCFPTSIDGKIDESASVVVIKEETEDAKSEVAAAAAANEAEAAREEEEVKTEQEEKKEEKVEADAASDSTEDAVALKAQIEELTNQIKAKDEQIESTARKLIPSALAAKE